jgi:small GTP-binding protein
MSLNQKNKNNNNDIIQAYKLVVLGEAAVGKSSICQRFINGKFTTLHQPTIGGLFLTKQVQYGERTIKFEIWDTAGQERFYSLTPLYYKNAKAAIVVFDISRSSSFERAQKWVKELIERADPGIVICLCGNKIDLEESRQIKKDDAEKYASSIGSFYCEVSAKLNLNVDEMFNIIVTKLPVIEIKDNNIKLDEDYDNNNESKGCTSYCYKS